MARVDGEGAGAEDRVAAAEVDRRNGYPYERIASGRSGGGRTAATSSGSVP